MSTYLSPLVSCIHCKLTKSAKGIFSHYLTAHTIEGKEKLDNARENSIAPSTAVKSKKLADKQLTYNLYPNKCIECTSLLGYNKKDYKFCSTSCAATYNNKLRNPRSVESRKNSSIAMTPPAYSKIKFCTCKECNTTFIWNSITKGQKTFCSRICRNTHEFERKSNAAKERGFGGVRQSKKILYNGVHLGSTYELILAKSLDANLIKWYIPDKIPYTDPLGKLRTYRADFYLPDFNVYLDPKNDFLINNINPALGFTDTEKIQCVMDQNDIQIIILNKNQLLWDAVKTLLNGETCQV